MLVVVVGGAVVAVVVGAGLWSAGSLLVWSGQVSEGHAGDHVWDATSAVGSRVRGVGALMVLAGAVGLGPVLWVAASLAA